MKAMKKPSPKNELPLYIPHSSTTTAANKTGSWRFYHPKYDEKTAPCSAACPVGQDIPRIEMLTSWGLFKEAWHLITAENPFPAVCGRVCFHPCEDVCNRNSLDAPIAVRNIERFLGDIALTKERKARRHNVKDRNKRVAIAGAGPAGLSAAYFLARLGYRCEVFEAASAPGGLLRFGIPSYRLPGDILDLEIERLARQGVVIHCDNPVTANTLKEISTDYDAVFIGCGYGRSIQLNIDGGHLARDGLELLRRIQRHQDLQFAGKAVVFGGGNTAIDVARSLARLGASPIIAYRRRIQDMPAFAPELEMAIQEGVQIIEQVAPIQIRQTHHGSSDADSRYTITLQKMKLGKTEIHGRPRFIPNGEKIEEIDARKVITAIGAERDEIGHFPATDNMASLDLSHCKLIEDHIPLVYGGDLTSPVKSVADAIASGKQAAMALDTYFEKGLDTVNRTLAESRVGPGPALSMDAYLGEGRQNRNAHLVTDEEIVTDYFQTAPRISPSYLAADRRVRSFAEVESVLSDKAARAEAARCFNCGSCNACDYCRLYCPEMAVKVSKGQRSIDMDYCKGCGVCATECPRNAMALEEEIK